MECEHSEEIRLKIRASVFISRNHIFGPNFGMKKSIEEAKMLKMLKQNRKYGWKSNYSDSNDFDFADSGFFSQKISNSTSAFGDCRLISYTKNRRNSIVFTGENDRTWFVTKNVEKFVRIRSMLGGCYVLSKLISDDLQFAWLNMNNQILFFPSFCFSSLICRTENRKKSNCNICWKRMPSLGLVLMCFSSSI